MRIESVTRANLEKVLPLIADYQRFYRMEPSLERNREYFGALAKGAGAGKQWLALDEGGRTIGFATVYLLPSSLSAAKSCVLNDLYTVPEARGRGVARALIARAAEYARAMGFAHLDWQTERGNSVARRLYDRMKATRGEWLSYSLDI